MTRSQQAGDFVALAPEEIEHLTEVGIRTSEQDHGHPIRKVGHDRRPVGKVEHGGTKKPTSGGRPQLMTVAGYGSRERGDGVGVRVVSEGLFDDQTVATDHGNTGDLRPGGESVDQSANHGRNVGAENCEVKKNRWLDRPEADS